MKNAVTFKLRTLLMVLLVLVGSFSAKASHFAAADIYVEYVGEGPTDLRYKVTLVLYRSCEGGA